MILSSPHGIMVLKLFKFMNLHIFILLNIPVNVMLNETYFAAQIMLLNECGGIRFVDNAEINTYLLNQYITC